MQTAYDVQDLVARFKSRGVDVAEDAVKAVIEEVFGWTEESIQLSATPFDNVALVVLPHLKRLSLEAADKIDGKVETA